MTESIEEYQARNAAAMQGGIDEALYWQKLASEAVAEARRGDRLHGPQLGLPLTWPGYDYELLSESNAQIRVAWRGEQGVLSWADILLEEVAEALQAATPADARTELVQVAAVALSAIRAYDRQHKTEKKETT